MTGKCKPGWIQLTRKWQEHWSDPAWRREEALQQREAEVFREQGLGFLGSSSITSISSHLGQPFQHLPARPRRKAAKLTAPVERTDRNYCRDASWSAAKGLYIISGVSITPGSKQSHPKHRPLKPLPSLIPWPIFIQTLGFSKEAILERLELSK